MGDLHYVDLNTIADVESSLQSHEDTIMRFAELWTDKSSGSVPAGISLFYLV